MASNFKVKHAQSVLLFNDHNDYTDQTDYNGDNDNNTRGSMQQGSLVEDDDDDVL